MGLVELKERFRRAAEDFSIIIHPVYFASNHLVKTDRGYKIPNETEIQQMIIGLADGLKEDDDAASSGGIILEIERDEEGNILDGSIGYQQCLSHILDEEIVDDDNKKWLFNINDFRKVA